jgi:hypothetical protein
MSASLQAECKTMVPPASRGEVIPAKSRAPYLTRALRTVCYGSAFGLCVALVKQQSIAYTEIYSISISVLCWLGIDGGRFVVSTWMERRQPEGAVVDSGWPGWPTMLAVVVVGSGFGFAGGTAIGDWLTGAHSPNLFGGGDLRQTLSAMMFVVIPAVAITYFFYVQGVIADREAATQAAQRQAAESRLRLLEAQLEPHMFFNTLANLHVLIALDPPRAQAMLDQLIAFLRATLSGSRAMEHPLRAEFSRLRDYLSLMQVRMEDRLKIHFELPEMLADHPVPPLLLQPLVENSIKHGLEPAVAGGLIDVRARRDGTSLVLEVRDTGAGLHGDTNNSTSFGLRQVRERLATLYGTKASLTLEPAGDAARGTLATIRLPMTVKPITIK